MKRIRACQRADGANKKCAECADTGPTYVCLDYQIFVCQLCSGLHRELGHRVKSLSLSQWSSKEVLALEDGGNEKAASKWLAQKGAREEAAKGVVPTDVSSIRELIKQKYVGKRWVKSDDEASTEDGSQDGASSEGPSTEAPAPGLADALEQETSVPMSSVGAGAGFVVRIPLGMAPGMQFRAEGPFGAFMVAVPPGAVPGQMVKLCVELPPAAAPVPTDLLGSPAAVPAAPAAPAEASAPGLVPGAEWVADFPCAEPKTQLADLMDFEVAPGPEKQVAVEVLPDSFDLTSVFGAAPSSQPMESAPPVARTAEVVEAPQSQSIDQPVAERLREAVLGGNNDAVRKLFQECTKPMERPSSLACRPVDSRFASLSDVFEESQREQMSRRVQQAAMQTASSCEPRVCMPDLGSAQAQNASAPCVSLDSWQPQGGKVPSNLSSDELMQCSPDELLKMQSLVAHALQAQQGGASTAEPISQRGPTDDVANKQMAVCPVPPKREFDDLLSLFNSNGGVYGR